MKRNKYLGASFDDFLAEEGLLESVNAIAQKRVLAWQLKQAMRQRQISRTEMARRMRTSRAALDRLLDPENSGVTLVTMNRAANALGKRLRIGLVDARR